jgi:hypothetical protein
VITQKNLRTVLQLCTISALFLLLTACDFSGIAATEPNLSEKIKALENSGVIPKLDRSSDIKGPDQNLNGVRDDIDAWIAALPITDKQKRAARQS